MSSAGICALRQTLISSTSDAKIISSSMASDKGIDSLADWLIPILGRPDDFTYLLFVSKIVIIFVFWTAVLIFIVMYKNHVFIYHNKDCPVG